MDSKSCVASQVDSAVRPHKDLPEFYADGAERPAFVSGLFDHTARYYDRISAALSFGTCRSYRRMALRRAGLKPGMRMLDVATGTGLAAQAALDLGIASKDLIGIDPSRGMLTENRKLRSIPLIQGCGESLPFPDASFDFICMGYALRHVEDLGVLFREFHRVLKPGGRVLILEISRPESRLVRAVAGFYLGRLLPAVTRWLTGDAEAGRLIRFYWVTIDECVPPGTIVSVLSASGLDRVERRRMGGVLNDYLAVKPV